MRIQNNTRNSQASFGMAFVKPIPGAMSHLTEYLTKNASINDAVSGLKEIMTEQAHNTHFNIEYVVDKNSFKVIPVSQQAKKLTQSQIKVFEGGKNALSKKDQLLADSKVSPDVLRKNGLSELEISLYKIKKYTAFIAEQFWSLLDPKRSLPKNLQQAVEYADSHAAKIEEDIYNNKQIMKLFDDQNVVKNNN